MRLNRIGINCSSRKKILIVQHFSHFLWYEVTLYINIIFRLVIYLVLKQRWSNEGKYCFGHITWFLVLHKIVFVFWCGLLVYLLCFLITYIGTKLGCFLLPTLFPFVRDPAMILSHTHTSQSMQMYRYLMKNKSHSHSFTLAIQCLQSRLLLGVFIFPSRHILCIYDLMYIYIESYFETHTVLYLDLN